MICKILDAIEEWMVKSGFIDQLSFIVTKTAIPRSVVMWASGVFATHGISSGQYSEVIIASAVTVLMGSMTMFVDRVRNKYAKAIQEAVNTVATTAVDNVKIDNYVGSGTVAAIQQMAVVANAAPIDPPSEIKDTSVQKP